jgi:hypothetical protein
MKSFVKGTTAFDGLIHCLDSRNLEFTDFIGELLV